MTGDFKTSIVLAVAVHGGVLFGLQTGPRAITTPLPEKEFVEVALVSAPAEMPEVAAKPAPAPAPAATAEVIQQPTPEIFIPKPEPVAIAVPERPVVEKLPEPEPIQEPVKTTEPVVHSVVEEPVVKASEPQVAAETSTKAAVESVEQNAPAISSVSSAANALPSANVGRTGNPNSRIVSTREANYRKQARHYYPPAAMRQKQQGTVVLELIINPRGKVEEIHVKESSGYPLLDNAARDMARRSEYVPARIGNELVTTRTEAAYRFVLPN